MRNKKNRQSNLGIAVVFSSTVIGLIFFSFVLRFFILVGDSKFDGVNSLSVLVSSQNLKQVVNFSPKNQSISILNVKDYKNQNLAKVLEIPIDGSFSSLETLTNKNISLALSKEIFNFKDQKDLNFMDFLRLFLFTNTVKQSSINEKTISNQTNIQDLLLISSSLFVDPVILEEKQSIEIVNATDVSGLGNRLAALITNIGGNVILVTTGDLEDKSQVQFSVKNYTAQRISRILNFKLIEIKKKSIPDIVITIGKDSLKDFKF